MSNFFYSVQWFRNTPLF